MNIKKFKDNLVEHYEIPITAKIVPFKDIDKYKIVFIENINPTHKKIIYGKRRKHYSIEKIAKIIIPSFIVSEILTLMLYLTVQTWSIFSIFMLFGLWLSDLDVWLFKKIFVWCDYEQSRKQDYRYCWE